MRKALFAAAVAAFPLTGCMGPACYDTAGKPVHDNSGYVPDPTSAARSLAVLQYLQNQQMINAQTMNITIRPMVTPPQPMVVPPTTVPTWHPLPATPAAVPGVAPPTLPWGPVPVTLRPDGSPPRPDGSPATGGRLGG